MDQGNGDLIGGRQQLERMISLRWLASVAAVGFVAVAAVRLPTFNPWLAIVVAALIPLSNVIHLLVLRRAGSSRQAMLAQFGLDLALLTGLIGALGGIDGPSFALYLLHVLLALLMLERRDALVVGAAAVGLAASVAGLQLLKAPFPLRSEGVYSALIGVRPPLNASAGFILGQITMLTLVSTVLTILVAPVVEEWRSQRYQLSLAEAETRSRMVALENILHNTGAMVLLLDRSHNLQWANQAVLKRFPQMALGQQRKCDDPTEPMGGGEAPLCPTCRVLATGERWTNDYTLAVPSGPPLMLRVYATPLVGPEGIEGVVEFLLDVTEERRSQQNLLEARKTAALTALAAGVAHEMNTPLGSLAAGLRTARRSAQGASETSLDRLLGDLLEQTERCQRIIESMLGYAREFRSRLVATEVDGIIRRSIDDLQQRRDVKGIEIVFEGTGAEIPVVTCAPDHLQMVLLNILTNAVDSLREAARVKPRIHIGVRVVSENEMVEVRIRDNGKGMAPEVLQHVFEPFFTTKAEGEGTGLGLAVSAGILKGMGSMISIDSAPDRGTDVMVRLRPAASDSPLLPSVVPPGSHAPIGKLDA
jgi:signal transduction histidine kinase